MLSPGTQVGSYTIVEFIASGGMEMVYKAISIQLSLSGGSPFPELVD